MAETETLAQIKSDMKEAMKDQRKEEVSTLRMLVSSLNNAKIDQGGDLDEDDVIEVLSKEAKQRRESIEAYEEGDRQDLADKEQDELEVIRRYLPEPLSDEEVEQMVDEIIEETGAETQGDMGRVMGQIMPKVKGRYEGSKVKDIVLEKLA
jgi:uncharacterized protein YqeY